MTELFASKRITARVYVFVPDCPNTVLGKSQTILAETSGEAQLRVASIWEAIPGAIYATGTTYPAERFSDGFVRALTDGRFTLAEDIERSTRRDASVIAASHLSHDALVDAASEAIALGDEA